MDVRLSGFSVRTLVKGARVALRIREAARTTEAAWHVEADIAAYRDAIREAEILLDSHPDLSTAEVTKDGGEAAREAARVETEGLRRRVADLERERDRWQSWFYTETGDKEEQCGALRNRIQQLEGELREARRARNADNQN